MSRPRRSQSDSDEEGEALILHRMSSDRLGRPYISSIPTEGNEDDGGRQDYGGKVRTSDDEDDEDDEVGDIERGFAPRKAFNNGKGKGKEKVVTFEGDPNLELPASMVQNDKDDKLGRPTWLRRTSRLAKRSARLRICFALIGLLLAAAVFAIAFAPGLDSTRDRIKGYASNLKDYVSGNHGGVQGKDGEHWYQGFPGPTMTGSPADWAEEASTPAGVQVATPTRGSSPIQTAISGFEGSAIKPFEHMGPLTPYRSSSGHGVDNEKFRDIKSLEGGSCELQQVHMLHRHGARYPTAGAAAQLVRKFLEQTPKPRFDGPLAFLNTYKYRLGDELLTPVGRQQLYDSGVHAAMEYGALIEKEMMETGRRAFLRAGSQRRIVDSALSFAQGLFGTYEWRNHTNLQVQIEAPGFNTTLASNFACPNSGKAWASPGASNTKAWIDKYLADAKTRLEKHVQGSSIALDQRILNGMQQLCSYDTVAFGQSDFCGLFNGQEWLDYEYAFDLQFYGLDAGGSPIGRAQGIGWVNEFMTRLEGKKWDTTLQTSENATLNSKTETFPLDRRFYADFTHDSVITAVLSAFELPELNQDLSLSSPSSLRRFKTSELVPFAARLVIEVLECGASATSGGTQKKAAQSKDRFVRFLLNDAVLPLGQLAECENRPDGMCSYDKFIQSQARRNERAAWSNCTRADLG